MTTATITQITVYWDTQDPANEGWAYQAIGGQWNRDITDSGPIEGVDEHDIDSAVAAACRILNCGATPDQFKKTATIDGGYAHWSA